MRTFTLIFILLIAIQPVIAQIVPSSCEAPDSVKEKYVNDADRMALRYIYRHNLPDTSKPEIPKQYSHPFLDALIAVYNANGLAESDTVTKIHKLHTFPGYDFYHNQHSYLLDKFRISSDTVTPWMQKLQNHILTTGHPLIDSLITTYGLTIDDLNSMFGNKMVRFQTDTNYNIPYIIKDLDTISGMDFASTISYMMETNNIYVTDYSPASSVIRLLYSHGWGDCPSGCMYRRYWEFKVYLDECSVKFVTSYGDDITSMTDNQTASKKLFPNPFTDVIQVEGINKDFDYMIFNNTGQQVLKGYSSDQKIKNLDWMSPGSYVLRIQTSDQVITKKILKK